MTLLLAAVPAAVLWGTARSRALKALGAVVVCYLAGVLLSTAGVRPPLEQAKTLSAASVALAIPLLLLSTDMLGWLRSARSVVGSFALACAAVVAAALLGGRLFGGEQARHAAAMLAAVYTGGTPNMSAVAVALGTPQETFLVANGVDMILSSIYLVFLTSLGRRWLVFLPPYPRTGAEEEAAAPAPFGARHVVLALLLALAAGALAGAASKLLLGKVSEISALLVLTSVGVAGSFVPALRRLPGAFQTGNYLLLVFCVAVGAMTRLESLLAGGWALPLQVLFTISSALLLHYAAAAALRLDRETVMITSTAAIMSPPFVVIVAAALKNKELLVAGITSGLVGYAIANYLGLAVYRLL